MTATPLHGYPGTRRPARPAQDVDSLLEEVRTRTDERTHRLARMEATLQGMLSVHGVLMALIGASLILSGHRATRGAFTALAHVPGWPWTWGAVAAALGATLVIARRLGRFTICRIVLHGMTAWSMAFALGLAAGALQAGTTWYPPLVYVAFAALYQLHAEVLTTPGLR